MIAIAYYLLKVMICSGILFLYYHLALRDKKFHQWNRFYLLAAIVVSLTVPLLKFAVENEDRVALIFSSVQAADNYVLQIQQESSFSILTKQWISIAYIIVSSVLFIGLIRAIQRIAAIIRQNEVQLLGDIKFVGTDVKGTPFSFFQYIFWNKEIDIQSQTGRQIFQHELVHVKEKHTLDKLFMQIIIMLFWINPFFWLIRREMQLIHEFIADKKAVEQHGPAAFAAMILQSGYPKQFNQITNQFFQTSIKRRLAMLTKVGNNQRNYFSRVAILPLMFFIVVLFSCRADRDSTEKGTNGAKTNTSEVNQDTVLNSVAAHQKSGNEKRDAPTLNDAYSSNPSNPSTVANNNIVEKVDFPPSVSQKEWRWLLEQNLQKIIEHAATAGMEPGQYTVKSKFVVNTDGTLTDIRALNDPGYGLAKAVIELLRSSDIKWTPAQKNGKKVSSYYTQPITFVIAAE